MDNIIFEVIDKTGRKIKLNKKQWASHIIRRHPQVSSEKAKIIETLQNPDKMFYYKYYKNRPSPNKFFRVIVKYLNGQGFIITAQFVPKIT